MIQIAWLVAINALIKPSFLFTLLPSVLIFWGYNKFNSAHTHTKFLHLSPYLFGLLFVAAEYHVIYQLNYTNSAANSIAQGNGHSSVILAPFEVWGSFSRATIIGEWARFGTSR